jgi:multiple sugar transport system substrate-binding protein
MKRSFGVIGLMVLGTLVFGAMVAAQQQVTITFWHTYSVEEAKFLVTRVIPAFEALHPNIKVKEVTIPYDVYREKLLTAIAAGEVPDVARVDIIWVPELAKMGVLSALDLLMPDFGDYKDRMFPGPLATNFWAGHYYGLPLNTNTRVLVWNKEMYDAAGIKGPPQTIEEFRAVCKAIKALGPDKYGFVDGGTYGWAVLPWIWSFGGDITDPNMTRATGYLNGPDTVAAYEFLRELFAEGHISPMIVGEAVIGAFEGYAQNVYANLFEGPWVGPIMKSMFPQKELHLALVPAGKGGSVSVVGGENIVLFEGSRNKEAALEFIRFMLSPSVQLAMADVGLITALAPLAKLWENDPYLGVFMEQLKTARPRLVHPAWAKIEVVLTRAGQEILLGVKTPQQALDDAAKEIDQILAEQ